MTNQQVRERVAEFIQTAKLLQKCVHDVFSTPLGQEPPTLSVKEYLQRQIFGDAEPDLLTRRQQLEQIRSALKVTEISCAK